MSPIFTFVYSTGIVGFAKNSPEKSSQPPNIFVPTEIAEKLPIIIFVDEEIKH